MDKSFRWVEYRAIYFAVSSKQVYDKVPIQKCNTRTCDTGSNNRETKSPTLSEISFVTSPPCLSFLAQSVCCELKWGKFEFTLEAKILIGVLYRVLSEALCALPMPVFSSSSNSFFLLVFFVILLWDSESLPCIYCIQSSLSFLPTCVVDCGWNEEAGRCRLTG